jgi:competence protein ComEC
MFRQAVGRKYRVALTVFAAALLLALATVAWGLHLRRATPGLLRVTFLDVGQGDATVIEGPTGRVVVVDGGGHPGTDERDGRDPGSRVVVPYLRSRGISTVDLLVPTHPDDDHVQGLVAVAERMNVAAALDSGQAVESGAYPRLRAVLRRRGVPVFVARRGQRVDLGGGAYMEVLNPSDPPISGSRSRTNDNGVVMRVVYGRARVLLTGDAEEEAEAAMAATVPDLSADVLKIGHHGSRWSSTLRFLARVRPSVAVISCGADNNYGHPHRETLERLAALGTRTYRTDRQGAIIMEADGTRIRIRSGK